MIPVQQAFAQAFAQGPRGGWPVGAAGVNKSFGFRHGNVSLRAGFTPDHIELDCAKSAPGMQDNDLSVAQNRRHPAGDVRMSR